MIWTGVLIAALSGILMSVQGVCNTGAVVCGIARLGTARAELIVVTAQLITAYLLALTGFPGAEREAFAWQKVFALTLTLGGVVWYSLS